MRSKGWLLAAAIVVTPALAHAQAVLDKPHSVLGEGVTLVVEGRFAEAEKPLREALRLDPTLAEGHYNLAVALQEQGHARRGHRRVPPRARRLHRASPIAPRRSTASASPARPAATRARGTNTSPSRGRSSAEQPAVKIAEDHRDELNGVKVPGTYQKASR